MQNYKIKFPVFTKVFLVIIVAAIFAACNKPLPDAVPIPHPTGANPSDQTIGDKISTDTNYNFYLTAATRVGVINLLKDPSNVITAFIPNNTAFRNSGIPVKEALNAMPITDVGAIVQYSIVLGQQFTSAKIAAFKPNMQLPTMLKIGDIPGLPVPLKMSLFPAVTETGFWVNNIPVVAADMLFKNGVMHNPAGLVAPPSKLLKDMIYANPNLSYFKAAVAKADEGKSGLESIDYLLSYPVTNMTVLVPDDNAFKTALFGLIYSYLVKMGTPDAIAMAQASALSSSPTVFSNPALASVLTPDLVRGLLAYHLLAAADNAGDYKPSERWFSNDFKSAPTFYKTLVNSGVATHPGILINPVYANPYTISKVTFTGTYSLVPGEPYAGPAAESISKDNHAVNGVYYVINQVLLPDKF